MRPQKHLINKVQPALKTDHEVGGFANTTPVPWTQVYATQLYYPDVPTALD